MRIPAGSQQAIQTLPIMVSGVPAEGTGTLQPQELGYVPTPEFEVMFLLTNYSFDSREGVRCELWFKRPSGPDSELLLP